MTPSRAVLQSLARATTRLAERASDDPLQHFRWLPPQHAFLTSAAKRKLIRTGNQVYGKTTVGLADVCFRCIGDHPFLQVRPPPIEAWVVCASWAQSLAIQQKLWALVPKWAVHPDTVFDPVKGFRGKNPALRFRNGSIIRIKTTNQGGLSLAGATIHVVLFDEPPKTPRIYGEVQKRVLKTNGVVMLAMTPVNAPTEWLQEACESGQVEDIHYPLRPEYLIPVGCTEPIRLEDGTVCDEHWIEQIRSETLAHEIPVVVDGEWEMRAIGNVFRAFKASGPDTHVRDDFELGEDWHLSIGIDHGSGKDFSSCAVLVAVDTSGEHDRIWIIDEYVSDGETTEDEDAEGILAMLRRNHIGRRAIQWRHLKRAFGDRPWGGRPHNPGTRVTRKDNRRLSEALAKQLGVKELNPPIRTVKRGKGRGAGSVHAGCAYLHRTMVRKSHFAIHPKAQRGIECIQKWDFADNEFKHWIDGLRYAVDHRVFSGRRRTRSRVYLYT